MCGEIAGGGDGARTSTHSHTINTHTRRTHLQRDQIEDGGDGALAARLARGVQHLQLLVVPELDPGGSRGEGGERREGSTRAWARGKGRKEGGRVGGGGEGSTRLCVGQGGGRVCTRARLGGVGVAARA